MKKTGWMTGIETDHHPVFGRYMDKNFYFWEKHL